MNLTIISKDELQETFGGEQLSVLSNSVSSIQAGFCSLFLDIDP